MIRFALVCCLVLGSYACTVPVLDKTVKDPAAAWTRLKQHRDSLAQGFKSEDWETADRRATQLSRVAGDLVRVSPALPANGLAEVKSAVRDLTRVGRQLSDAARSKNSSRVPELLQRVDYFIDGIGRAMGLTRLAGVEPDAARANGAVQAASSTGVAGAFREDTVQIDIPEGTGLEYKFQLAKGAVLDYTWKADRGIIFSELHGEPQGDTSGYYEDFNISTASSVQGSLEAPFDGRHGWYWKNENEFPVSVTLTTRGIYTVLGKKSKK